MDEYKEKFQMLYLETTKALRILTEVQRECTQAYVSALLEGEDETETQE